MSRPRALLVEDDFLIGLELAMLTEGLGLEVLGPFADLEEARARGREGPLAVALLDVNLGGLTTFALATELVERQVPCAFVTGYSHIPGLPARLAALPVLAKPFTPTTLRHVVERLLWR